MEKIISLVIKFKFLINFIRSNSHLQSLTKQRDSICNSNMDFETLQEIIPKKSQMWSNQDISKWLDFINLPNLIQAFRQAGIDGSCIHLLDEEILKSQLHISSPIIRKKLINWVGMGLNGFNDYISSISVLKIEGPVPSLKKSETTNLRKQAKPKLLNHSENLSNPIMMETQEQNSQNYLILEQYEGNSLGFNIIKNQIMSIGFGKFNHIHSLQTSISERHALIGRSKMAGNFFVQDLGSKHGTYVKINQRTVLRNGMILQIGSYQFMVTEINISTQTLKLKQTNQIEGEVLSENNKNLQNMDDLSLKQKKIRPGSSSLETLLVDLKANNKFSFGRRKENNFQREDKHMSGMHCKITFHNNNFYIEDYGSTNGTWLRISPEFVASPQVNIQNQMFIKLGTAITYVCRIKNNAKQVRNACGEMIDENTCKFCEKEENNCLFVPCGHNVCCIGCSQKVGDTCSQCSHVISDKIKIHK